MLSEINPTSHGAPLLRTTRPTLTTHATEEVYVQTSMRVTKRNGGSEPVDVNKIVRRADPCTVSLRAPTGCSATRAHIWPSRSKW